MKKIANPMCPIAFGESGAKQPQDEKPCRVMAKLNVRAGSVDYSLWSHPSLHSRRGSRLTATWPQLARLNLAQSIPARPFGLRLRYDGTLLVAHRCQAARSIKPTPRGDTRVTIKSSPVNPQSGNT